LESWGRIAGFVCFSAFRQGFATAGHQNPSWEP
jgi:hypothetical protein